LELITGVHSKRVELQFDLMRYIKFHDPCTGAITGIMRGIGWGQDESCRFSQSLMAAVMNRSSLSTTKFWQNRNKITLIDIAAAQQLTYTFNCYRFR
jgi:hypothetical protein